MEQLNFNSIKKLDINNRSLNEKIEESINKMTKGLKIGGTGNDMEKNNFLQGLVNRIDNIDRTTNKMANNYQKLKKSLMESMRKIT